MAYVAPSTVTTLQTYTSAAHNIIVNDIIDINARVPINAGLPLINTTTVSAAATTNFDGVFSSLYQVYLITFTGTTSGTGYVNIALRTGGSTTGGTGYRHRSAYINATATAFLTGASSTSAMNVCQGDTTGLSYEIKVYRPFEAVPTRCDFYAQRDAETQWGGGSHTASTSFDGFSITHDSAQTATGTWRVYGLRNAV